MSEEVIKKFGVSYLRVSSTEQVQNFSLQNQQESTSIKAVREGYELLKEFNEPGQSAKDTNRPALQELLKFVLDKKNKISAVFVYKWDRLSRNQLDFLSLRHLLAQHGVSLISATETSGDTPEALFLQNILGSAAQYDNDVKSFRVKDGLRKRFKEGYTTTRPPMGYVSGNVDGRIGGTPHETYFPLMRSLWHKIDEEKLTLGQAKTEMEKIFNRVFYLQTISKVFSNKYYMGIISSPVYGEAHGKHQPMIDNDTFYRVRELITGRKQAKEGIRKDMREELPLRGHLVCPKCGKNMTGCASTSKSGKRVWYYICNERKLHKTYETNADKVNTFFHELVKNIRVKKNAILYFSEHIKERYQMRYNDLIQSGKVIEREMEELVTMIETLKVKHLKGIYSDEDFVKMKDDFESQYTAKKSLLAEKQIDKLDIQTILEWNTYYLTHLDELWLKADIELKHRIQSSILPKKWTYDKENNRTPEIGYIYSLNEAYEAQISNQYPQVIEYRTLIEGFINNYNDLSPYIQHQLA